MWVYLTNLFLRVAYWGSVNWQTDSKASIESMTIEQTLCLIMHKYKFAINHTKRLHNVITRSHSSIHRVQTIHCVRTAFTAKIEVLCNASQQYILELANKYKCFLRFSHENPTFYSNKCVFICQYSRFIYTLMIYLYLYVKLTSCFSVHIFRCWQPFLKQSLYQWYPLST